MTRAGRTRDAAPAGSQRPGGVSRLQPGRPSIRRLLGVLACAAVMAGACGGSGVPQQGTPGAPVPAPAGSSPAPAGSGAGAGRSPSSSAAPAATGSQASGPPSPSPVPPAPTVPLAVATGFANYRITGVTSARLATLLRTGKVVVPCGAGDAIARELGLAGTSGWAPCARADAIPAHLSMRSSALALLPAGLVSARIRVVPLDGADLFGEKPARSARYPLTVPVPASWPVSWSAYDVRDVRVVLGTGVNCPDRDVSRQTVVLGRGWDWLLKAGTARYTGTHWDARLGWTVVDATRTGNSGAVRRLIRDADVAVSDFECPMTRNFVQHDTGTTFSIDPRVATLMAKAGFDVATPATDHATNAGLAAVGETVDRFRAAGIATTGTGRTLAQALRPAIVDAGGVTFGFVGFDAIGGSAYATASSPGVAPLTTATARKAIAAARKAGADVVIALPQWSSVEYRAAFTPFQRTLMAQLYAAGADHIVGADFHWAGAVSITPGGRSGDRFAGASQGNFWFGQDWSRQTMEGVMTMLTFSGTRLVQARLIPTVVLDGAQPNLTDPATDGQYVLHQALDVSEVAPAEVQAP